MTHNRGASADAETGFRADASSPQAVSTEGFNPARELERMVDELLDPLQGIERGLRATDEDRLLLNIRAGELRKVGRCLRLVATKFLGEKSA